MKVSFISVQTDPNKMDTTELLLKENLVNGSYVD